MLAGISKPYLLHALRTISLLARIKNAQVKSHVRKRRTELIIRRCRANI